MERLNYFSLFKSTKKEDSCVNWRVLCCLLRVAHVLGEEEIAKKLIEFLQTPNAYSFNVLSNLTTVFEEMSEVVSREEFTTIVNGLLENTLKEVKELSCNLNIVYTKWPGLIASLVQVIPHSNPTLLELLDVLAIHEKRYKSMSIGEQMRFYGLQQKEIPLDFPYQMASKEFVAQYPTARQFEAVLCLKGNTYLNTKEASDRMTALKLLLKFAAQSQDVRVLHRCINLYTKTELKFSDISLDISEAVEIFSPDVLGLSEKSLAMSGSAEVAAKARQGVIDTLVEWGSMKKGDLMVKPLCGVMCALFTYASMYPEYEDSYCQLLEPVVRLLVSKKNNWTISGVVFHGKDMRVDHVKHLKREGGVLTESELQLLQPYFILEKYLRGQVSWICKKTIYARSLTVPGLNVPSDVDVTPMSKKCLVMILNLLNTMEDVSLSYVASMIYKLLDTCWIGYAEDKIKTESIYEDSTKIIKEQTVYRDSQDALALRELLLDKSLTWSGQMQGLSLIQSLCTQTVQMGMCSSYFSTECPVSETKYSVVPIDRKKNKKRESIYSRMQTSSQVKRVYVINHCPETMNQILTTMIEKDMTTYAQFLNTINNVAMTQDGLTWCLTASSSCFLRPLFFVKGEATVKDIQKILRVTTEANLRSLFKLASLYLHIILQACVLAASLNKSDTPVLDPKIVMKIPNLQKVLYDNLTVLLLMNREIAYRHLEMEERYVTIQCLAPFLTSWLQSVAEKRKQTMKEVRFEDSFVIADTKAIPVTLDLMDNQVVGRLAEIMVYSRLVKEFFGKELKGFVDVVSMMDTTTVLLICRRMLVVSSFVPYAESLIRRVLVSTTDETVLSQIVDMFFDASNAITVALMGLVFRVSALPVMASQSKRLKTVISTMTDYVIRNDFQSASAYVIIIRWVFSTLLSSEDPDEDFLRDLLLTISKLDLKEKAGQSVFDLTLFSAFLVCDVNSSPLGRPSNETKSFITTLQGLLKESTPSRRTLLKTFLVDMVMQFETQDDETLIQKQFSALRYLGVSSLSDSLIHHCEEILEQQWRPFDNSFDILAATLILLYTTNPERAVTAFTKGRSLIHAVKALLSREEPVDAEALIALKVDSTYHSYLKESGVTDEMPGMLMSNQGAIFPLKTRVEFLCSLNEVEDSLLPLVVLARALKDAISYPAKDIVTPAEATVDIVKFVSELEKTLEPWMYVSVVKHSPCVISFSKTDYATLFKYFKETKKEVALVLLCAGLDGYYIHDNKMRDYIQNWIQVNHNRSLYFYSD